MNRNQRISGDELRAIRGLSDFDLTMLISEIHDHGWPAAQRLLPMILLSEVKEQGGGQE